MRFQKGKFALFVKGDLFEVKTGTVDVRDENSHALFDFSALPAFTMNNALPRLLK